MRGRIYRIVYQGGSAGGAGSVAPCPSAAAPAGDVVVAAAKPPEGTHPDAGSAIPQGATPEMVALGDRIYHGQVGGAACAGCHGANGTGSPLGPDLTGKKWLWSDGSLAGILKSITEGVPQPKQYRSPMPPMGGAQLTPDQLKALTAYVWSLSHQATSPTSAAPAELVIPGERLLLKASPPRLTAELAASVNRRP
jgi:mono/diheme cytochrome c family protein